MLIIGKAILSFFLVAFVLQYGGYAQTNCKDIDLIKVPGKWVWDKSGGGGNPATNSQWAICEPIRKELQRILPKQVDGIIATNSIDFGSP